MQVNSAPKTKLSRQQDMIRTSITIVWSNFKGACSNQIDNQCTHPDNIPSDCHLQRCPLLQEI